MDNLKPFSSLLFEAARNLMPIVGVVLLFQGLVFRRWPEQPWLLLLGLAIVILGVALFIQGLELSVFPLGRNLANALARKGSLVLMLIFGFALGFAAVVAEPALIAVATQAEALSEGQVRSWILRLLIALSVGLVLALGILRTSLGHPIQYYVIPGYLLVLLVTSFSPVAIVGLAYDSGGVTTNIVTVPLIAALGIGLASSLKGRNALQDGFGLVSLAVMVPMITVQIYGIFAFGSGASMPPPTPAVLSEVQALPWLLQIGQDLLKIVLDVSPVLGVVLFFQWGVIRKPVPYFKQVLLGGVLVVLGLYAFVKGLKLGLFPLGKSMAEQLIAQGQPGLIYLFAFAIGLATTLAEPALVTVAEKVEEVSQKALPQRRFRFLVALGVALGLTVGIHRLLTGGSLHLYISVAYLGVLLLTWFAPRYIIAVAYDAGGVTTSEVTVPLITALGIGLASHLPGRNPMLDGFGLIAFASIFPMFTLMGYAIMNQRLNPLQVKEET